MKRRREGEEEEARAIEEADAGMAFMIYERVACTQRKPSSPQNLSARPARGRRGLGGQGRRQLSRRSMDLCSAPSMKYLMATMMAMAEKTKSAVVDQISPELILLASSDALIAYSGDGLAPWWPPASILGGRFCAVVPKRDDSNKNPL